MDDPSRFTSINEYYTFIYAISYMMFVELGIWIYNFKGWLNFEIVLKNIRPLHGMILSRGDWV